MAQADLPDIGIAAPISAQVLIAIGLTYCSISASGQTARMSSAIFHRCGTVRRPRMMPPTPKRVGDGLAQAVGSSAPRNRSPCRACSRRSGRRRSRNRPLKRRALVACAFRPSPARPARRPACAPPVRFPPAASCRCPSARSWHPPARACAARRRSMFFMNTVDPAPMKAILVI